MTKYHVITHTHWDREWYFTKEETKVLLKQHMLDLFLFLNENPTAVYVLDGQSVMIDDFLELAPEYRDDLIKYIENGNILVGPWYTQTDLMLVRGESIVRNLQYGLQKARQYTKNPMLVGYAPDTFGHNVQMPQIYKQFGIDSTYFWRGVSKQKSKNANFKWKALDGSEVFAHSLSAGYQGGKYLMNAIDDIEERLATIKNKYTHYNATTPVLVMNGHDQMPVQKDIFEIMDTYNQKHGENKMYLSDFETYRQFVEKNVALETVSGELYDAEFTRVHKTISSTRMDIKYLNTLIEDTLYNHLEPLSVIASGIGLPYPHALIEQVLEILFGVHAHDSLGGCNTDAVNQAILQRLLDAQELVENQVELTLRQIGLVLQEQGYDGYVVNVLPYTIEQMKTQIQLQTEAPAFVIQDVYDTNIEYQIVQQVLADMGEIDRQILARRLDVKRYASDVVINIEKMEPLSILPLKIVEDKRIEIHKHNLSHAIHNTNSIENEHYEIQCEEGLSLYIKSKDILLENFITIEQNGDAGDGYDYSPLVHDWIIASEQQQLECLSIQKGLLEEKMTVKLSLALPYDEKDRVMKKARVLQEYIFELILQRGMAEIEVKLTTENKCKDQRTRLVLKTTEISNEIIADTQFGEITRPVQNPNLSIWEQESWVEKPVSIEHFEHFVSINHQNTFYSRGLKEYESVDDKMYFTLFRSFGYMGRSDLVNRPGRASGMSVETPLNQLMNKEFTFQFWLNYLEEKKPALRAKVLMTNMLTYQVKEYNRFNLNMPQHTTIKSEQILYPLELDTFVITAIKKNDEDKIIIRGYNPSDEQQTMILPNGWQFSNIEENSDIINQEQIIRPYQIFTLIKN